MIRPIKLDLPRPVTALHQLELESRCNLRCVYCPSPNLGRPKQSMERATFLRALEWVKHFVREGTQRELNLAGIGESTLHPEFFDFIALAREAAGPHTFVNFTTNGLLFTEELAKHCQAHGVSVFVSLHRPEKAGPAVNLARKYGVLAGVSNDPALAAINWAGQVDWEVTATPGVRGCPWIRQGRAMAMADGRVTTCCYDATGAGVIGHVNDPIGSLKTKPYSLCRTCEQEISVVGFDQRAPQ